MKEIIIFFTCFFFIYLVYYITLISNKKKMKQLPTSNQALYFKNRYKIDFNSISIKSFAHSLALTNAFILSITVVITEFVHGFIVKMLVGLIILIPLMLMLYHLIAKFYQKK